MPEKNREYDMTAEDLTIDGMGVGRIDGMAVFAEGLLPGERGRVLVIKKAKKYAVAKTLEVYETSPDRVKPQCGVFQQCGGCSLMHLRYEAQLAYKQGRVSRLLAVNGGVSVPPEDILPSPQMLRYRNKTAFPVKQGKEGLLIGCYAKRSHRVVNTEQCLCSIRMRTRRCRLSGDGWRRTRSAPMTKNGTRGWCAMWWCGEVAWAR